jgi:hypothetical protein
MKIVSVVFAFALLPGSAAAHALDEYVQAARLSLAPSHVGLDMDLTPGVQVAASIVATIDRDQDGVITPAEAAAYATRVLEDTVVELDGMQLTMTLTRIDVPTIPEMRDGMGTIRLRAIAVHGARLGGTPVLTFRNDHAPEGSVYLVNALVPDDVAISVLAQEREWSQRSARITYRVKPGLDVQLSWIAIALATGFGLVIARRRGSLMIE